MSKPVDYAALTEKQCTRCHEVKPVSEFYKYNDASAVLTGWRYYAWCRECSNANSREYSAANRARRNERVKKWRRDNPEAARRKDRTQKLRRKYGLTEVEANELLAMNDGRCLICDDKAAVAIDHDHKTGQVRGGLCISCNTFLGRVEANPTIIQRMAAYIGLDLPCHADVLIDIANEVLDEA